MHSHIHIYIHIYIYIYTHPNNTLAITNEKVWMRLPMLWYQLLRGEIILNQQRLKLQYFLVLLLLKTIFSYFIKINKFFYGFYKIY